MSILQFAVSKNLISLCYLFLFIFLFFYFYAGSVLRCDVTGKILMKCFLSGMPDLKLGLNDKIGLEKESQMKSRPTKRSYFFNVFIV